MKPNHMELMNPSQNALIQWSKREVRVVVRPFWVARQKWFLSHRLLTDYSNKIHPDLSPPALTKAPLSGILFAMEELSHVSSRLTTRVICIILIGSIASRHKRETSHFFSQHSASVFFFPASQSTNYVTLSNMLEVQQKKETLLGFCRASVAAWWEFEIHTEPPSFTPSLPNWLTLGWPSA